MRNRSSASAVAAVAFLTLLGCKKAAPAEGDETAGWIEQLKDADAGKRRDAASNLGHSRAKSAVPALTGALQDDEWQVRSAAAVALGQIGPDAASATARLVEVLQKDARDSVRGDAAWALGRIGPGAAAAVPALMKALSDEAAAERAAAALETLGEGTAAAERLTAVVKDATASPETRAAALKGLRRAGDRKQAVSLMTSIIEDGAAPPKLRGAAAAGVGYIAADGGAEAKAQAKAAVPALLANLDQKGVSRYGPWSLWALGATEEGVARLSALLASRDPEVRRWAASGLATMAGGNPPREAKAAVPALIQALAIDDDARGTVVRTLGAIGPDAREALPALEALLEKEDDKWTRDGLSEAIKKIAPNP